MSDEGDHCMDLVELFRGAPRLTTARAEAKSRKVVAMATTVSKRWLAQLRPLYPPGAFAVISPTGGSGESVVDANEVRSLSDAEDVWTESVWVSVPDRSRVEGVHPPDRAFVVIVGDRAWTDWAVDRSAIGGSLPVDPGKRELDARHREVALALLHPSRLLRGYALRTEGHAEIAGRSAIRLRGLPTYDARSVYESGGEDEPTVCVGADEVEFMVDAERGVVLRWAGFVAGEEYGATTFINIAFDEMLDERLFDPTLANGEPSQP